GDGEAVAVGVKRAAIGGSGGVALGRGPAVVGAGDAVVNLFPGALADVVDEHPAGPRLKIEGEGVAKAKSPYSSVHASSGVVERVIERDGAVRVEAEDLAQQVVQGLGVGGVGVLSHGDVELAVRTEMEGAAVVVGGARQIIEFEDNRFAAGQGHVPAGEEAADAVMAGRRA